MVKCPSLDLGSGLDVRGHEFKSCVGLHAGHGAYLKQTKYPGTGCGSGSQSVNKYSTVYFVPDMVLGTGDTRTTSLPSCSLVRVTLNAPEGIVGGGIVGNSPRSGIMPTLKKGHVE